MPKCSNNPKGGPCIIDSGMKFINVCYQFLLLNFYFPSQNSVNASPVSNQAKPQLWTNGIIPYALDSMIFGMCGFLFLHYRFNPFELYSKQYLLKSDSSQILKIHEAMGDIMQSMEYDVSKHVITFKKWTTEANYVDFVKRSKCSSQVGQVGNGRQVKRLSIKNYF